jgi:hypothetical protein
MVNPDTELVPAGLHAPQPEILALDRVYSTISINILMT